MTLAEKLRHLRYVEGLQRGLGRPLSKADVTRLMRQEVGPQATISAAYLSQLESGARGHMTERTRARLAAFFKVLPGYLVNDPPGYETELQSGASVQDAIGDDPLTHWLTAQALAWHDDPLIAHVLHRLARRSRPRRDFEAIDALLDAPEEDLAGAFQRSRPVETEVRG